MITDEHVHEILGRIATGNQTDTDIAELRLALSVTQRGLQPVKYNVHLIDSRDIQIGDKIYQGVDADAIRPFLQQILNALNSRSSADLTYPWSEVRAHYLEQLEQHFRYWSERYTDLRLTSDIRVATYKGQRLGHTSVIRKCSFDQALKRKDEHGKPIAECVVMLGDPGGGKTTACQTLAWRFAKEGLASESSDTNPRIPIYMELSGYRSDTSQTPDVAPYQRVLALLAQEMKRFLAIHGVPLSPQMLEEYLRVSPFIFFFDGLNEIGVNHREAFIGDLLSFIETFRGHDHQFVVTTRKFDYEYDLARPLSHGRFQILEILELDSAGVNEFVMRDLGRLSDVNRNLAELRRELKLRGLEILDQLIRGDYLREEGEELVLQIKKLMRNVPGLPNEELAALTIALQAAQELISILRQPDYSRVLWLAQNPSTLKDVIDVYRDQKAIPHSRILLFERAIHARLSAQSAKLGRQRSRFPDQLKFAALQKIALQMIHPEHGLRLEKGDVLTILKDVLEDAHFLETPHDLLEECVLRDGLLVEKTFGTYSFIKHPYQEYFAARALCDQWRSCFKSGKPALRDKYLGPIFKDRYYLQVASSMAGLLAPEEVQELLQSLRKKRRTQRLAALCGRNAEQLPEEAVNEYVDWTRRRILRFSLMPEGVINAAAIFLTIAVFALFFSFDHTAFFGRISFDISRLMIHLPYPSFHLAFFNLFLAVTCVSTLLVSLRLIRISHQTSLDWLNISVAVSMVVMSLLLFLLPFNNLAAGLATLSGLLWIVLVIRVTIASMSPVLNWANVALEEHIVNHYLIHYLEVMRDIGPNATSTINEIQYSLARNRFMSERIKDAIQRTWAISPRTVLQVINELGVSSRHAEALKVLESAVLVPSTSSGLREKAVAALFQIADVHSNNDVMLGVVDVLGNIALEQTDYRDQVIEFLKPLMNSEKDLRVRRRVWRTLNNVGLRDIKWPRRTLREMGMVRLLLAAFALIGVCILILMVLAHWRSIR